MDFLQGTILSWWYSSSLAFLRPTTASFQVDGGQDGAISAIFLLPEHAMKFMANKPKSILRSAMLGDRQVDLDETNLRVSLSLYTH